MKVRKKLITVLFLSLLSAFSVLADKDFRNWTNKDGNSIEAKFIKFKDEKIEIRRKDGFTFTLEPKTLSEVDQNYLEQLIKHRDASGRVWHRGNYEHALVRQKWFDTERDDRGANFYEFKKDKIDINEDKIADGFRVRIFSRLNKTKFKDKAWEIDDEGIVTLKSANSHTMYEGKYKYDFEKRSFVKLEGYGPPFFISAD
jgi:hypothetical protein